MIRELMERAEGDIKDALKNPDDFDMRREKPEKMIVDPEPSRMKDGVFDLANSTSTVRYSSQSCEEGYTCFKESPDSDLAFVESDAVHDYGGIKIVSTLQYVVDGDELYRFTERGLEEVDSQLRPAKVAERFDEMYRKAVEAEGDSENHENERTVNYSREPVTPPEDEVFSD